MVVERKKRSALEPGDRAVVEDDARVVEHGPVADAALAQVAEAVGVEPVEELAGVGTRDVELAEGAHVDQAGCLVDGPAFGRDIAVVEGPLPVAHVDPRRPERIVSSVNRRPPDARQVRPGERGERDRLERRAGRGQARLGGRRTGDLGVHPGGE